MAAVIGLQSTGTPDPAKQDFACAILEPVAYLLFQRVRGCGCRSCLGRSHQLSLAAMQAAIQGEEQAHASGFRALVLRFKGLGQTSWEPIAMDQLSRESSSHLDPSAD